MTTANSALAQSLPGPFPWGASAAQIVAEVRQDEPDARVANSVMRVDLDGAYHIPVEVVFQFDNNVLAGMQYNFRPQWGQNFIPATSLLDLRKDLVAKYGTPELDLAAGPVGMENWIWRAETETVTLAIFSADGHTRFMKLKFKAPE